MQASSPPPQEDVTSASSGLFGGFSTTTRHIRNLFAADVEHRDVISNGEDLTQASGSGSQETERLLNGSHSTYGSARRYSNGNMRRASAQGGHERIYKLGLVPRPVGGHEKLGTFSGVFIPTALNVLSILMFLRFGFILGQTGILAMMLLLVASYIINLVTTLSISAIATNGTVRGGGAYYLISRSLGPEFGGSIGLVFYVGFVLNTGLNAVGLVDCFRQNFGSESGSWGRWMPESFGWTYLMSTGVLLICTLICLGGSALFARASKGLLALLLLATFSIPISAMVLTPFVNTQTRTEFTGISRQTFQENFWPHFTRGAAGSLLTEKENYQDMFGILFPATGGIFAGASMSGDLKTPSRSIPRGTLQGLALTFIAYSLVILSMGASITRSSFYHNLNVIQDTSLSAVLILLGEFATSFFSTLMGVIGSAKLLQALARDSLFPGLSFFGQGTKKADEPTYAIMFTFLVAQITMLFDLNMIAAFITMTYLMTFFATNLACFLLKVSSAPNFRPSFRYFGWYSAAFGALVSGATMFFVDGLSASASVAVLIILFLLVHYTTPPKPWGDVSQSLIYHQVRKYLLRLRPEHVKFWRPQILLFINNPRTQWKLIQFCNSLKKGSLYVIGHVIIADDFGGAVPEARLQQVAWTKFIEFSKIKAFVNLAISPAVEWGARNIVLSAGLGGMRPNITIIGFYNLDNYRKSQQLLADMPHDPDADADDERKFEYPTKSKKQKKIDPGLKVLPTDDCRTEIAMSPQSYVTILEDLLLNLQNNVAVAKGFDHLQLPHGTNEKTKKYIDLWPIQMSAEIETEAHKANVMTTNFDTYTLILQLGCILETVSTWKKHYKVRVVVFVEYESEVNEEAKRVRSLLDNLRIRADVLVLWLACGTLKSYEVIVNGADPVRFNKELDIDAVLSDEDWWVEVNQLRKNSKDLSSSQRLAQVAELVADGSKWPSAIFQQGRRDVLAERFSGLKKFLSKSKRRHTISGLNKIGVNIGMRTHRLHPDLMRKHAENASASEGSSSDDGLGSVFSSDDEESDHGPQSPASLNDISYGESDDELAEMRSSQKWRRKSLGDVSLSLERSQQPDEMPAKSKAEAKPTPVPENGGSSMEPANPTSRPNVSRHASRGRFTSKPVPETEVAKEETTGPSIKFAEDARRSPKPATRTVPTTPASGFPVASALSLSFNDLPCRAQHLILNELMRQHTADTAVMMTTLPGPHAGTYKEEADSLKYLVDLEVLCERLPPVLLVHSNSVTVTTNL